LVSQVSASMSGVVLRTARLMTAHQIGTVLDSASGMRFPALVESAKSNLERVVQFSHHFCLGMRWHHEPCVRANQRQYMQVWPTKVEAPISSMSICRLEICALFGCLGKVRGALLVNSSGESRMKSGTYSHRICIPCSASHVGYQ